MQQVQHEGQALMTGDRAQPETWTVWTGGKVWSRASRSYVTKPDSVVKRGVSKQRADLLIAVNPGHRWATPDRA